MLYTPEDASSSGSETSEYKALVTPENQMELFYYPGSPLCRSVMMLIKTLSLDVDMKFIDIIAKEQMQEEYVKMNPQHTVPFLADEEFTLSESRAILIYLVEMYGKETSLYPEDPKERALVNQRLFFDIGTLNPRFGDCYLLPVLRGKGLPREDLMPLVDEAFALLNLFLDGQDWVAGPNITIADYALVATVSTAEGCGYDVSSYENVFSWLTRCKEQIESYEEANQAGLDGFLEFYNAKLAELNS